MQKRKLQGPIAAAARYLGPYRVEEVRTGREIEYEIVHTSDGPVKTNLVTMHRICDLLNDAEHEVEGR